MTTRDDLLKIYSAERVTEALQERSSAYAQVDNERYGLQNFIDSLEHQKKNTTGAALKQI